MKNTHLLTTLLSLFLFCTTLQALSIRNPFRTRNPLLVKENAQPRDIVYVVLELTFEGSGSDNFEVRELKIPLGGMVEAGTCTITYIYVYVYFYGRAPSEITRPQIDIPTCIYMDTVLTYSV